MKKLLLTTSTTFATTLAMAEEESAATATITFGVDHLWVLVSAALVFFMQAGFKAFEVGMVRVEHRNAVGIKNIIDWIAGSLIFFFLGFGLMFGKSYNGLFGTDLFFGSNIEGNPDGSSLGMIFFLFSLDNRICFASIYIYITKDGRTPNLY